MLASSRLRIQGALFNALRDLIFVKVMLRTVSSYAQLNFSHLHALDASFHARRQIGALLPEIDRGTNGIAFLLGISSVRLKIE